MLGLYEHDEVSAFELIGRTGVGLECIFLLMAGAYTGMVVSNVWAPPSGGYFLRRGAAWYALEMGYRIRLRDAELEVCLEIFVIRSVY